MNPINEDLLALGDLGESLNKIMSDLRPGGPTLSLELLVGYIDGVLDPEARQQVAQHIVTWRDWYDAYWKTVNALVDDDPSSNPVDDKIQEYISQNYVDLVAQLPLYATAVRSDPLGPYRADLRTIICEKWNWTTRKSEPLFADEIQLTAAVAKVLTESLLDMPFPVSLVAAILVKEGLDGLCAGRESL